MSVLWEIDRGETRFVSDENTIPSRLLREVRFAYPRS